MSAVSLIVVVYNQAIGSVPAIQKAIRSNLVAEIIVCDNSTFENDNAALSEELGICYIDMEGNKGLASAYRAGVERCHGDVICLFDDDTEVEEDYFISVRSLDTSSKAWDVALPLVMSGDAVLSPCLFNGYRAHQFADIYCVEDCPELSGINSGMAIKRSLFNDVQHDTSLFLDLIDHQFISDVKGACGRVVYLRGPVLNQSYSLKTDKADSALSRLLIFERDARYFYKEPFSRRLYCEVMLMGRKIKLCLKYRSPRFLKPKRYVRGA